MLKFNRMQKIILIGQLKGALPVCQPFLRAVRIWETRSVIDELGAVVMSLEGVKCLHRPTKHPKREMETKSDWTKK